MDSVSGVAPQHPLSWATRDNVYHLWYFVLADKP
jgi:hypothetical protein